MSDAFEGIVLGQKFSEIGQALRNKNQTIQNWMDHATELEQENARLKQQLAIARAYETGLGAQLDAMLEVHPNTPLREKTNIRYNDANMKGDFKNKLVLIYENAFDKKALELGIRDPKRIRRD